MAKGYNSRFNSKANKPRPIVIPDTAKFMAFTQKYNNGLTNRIQTPIGLTPAFKPDDYPNQMPYPVTEKLGLWDTGATGSVLTSATVKQLNLQPIGTTIVNHAGGTSQSNTYLVNFYLPNHVAIIGVIVSECEDIAGNFGAIIGMDIITRGDFSITNVDNKTWVSFRLPSKKSIDYVEEFNGLAKKYSH